MSNGSNGSILETAEGNTTTTLPRVSPVKYWCFALNNWNETEKQKIIKTCKEKNIEYTIGEEIGSNGTAHLQGFISRPKAIRAPELFNNKRIHWEKSKASKEKNIAYCSKDGNVITNMITKEDKRKAPKIPLWDELYDWQKDAINKLNEQNDRQILWIVDEEGGKGKTTLCKYLIFNNDALIS